METQITEDVFGSTDDGVQVKFFFPLSLNKLGSLILLFILKVDRYTLLNGPVSLQVINYGATITSLKVKSKPPTHSKDLYQP